MPLDRDQATILDLVVAGRRIREFISDEDFEAFSADLKTQSAVLHQLMILGEACKRLSRELREQHPEIAWSDIMRMRDKLIHHYEAIDLSLVWKTATREVPELVARLASLIKEQPANGESSGG